MKWWIKFLKDFEDSEGKKFTKDMVFETTEAIANGLIALKIAEKTEAPKEADVEKLFDTLGDTMKDLVEKTIEKTVKEIDGAVRKKVPAVPIDEREKGMHGFKSVTEYFQAVKNASTPGGIVDKRLHVEKGDPTGASTAVDSEGGALVPEIISAEMMDVMLGDDAFESQTDQRTTTSNNLKIKGFNITGHSEQQRNAGIVSYWMDEADAYTASMMKFNDIRLEIHKLGALAYVTEEELSDSTLNWGSQLLNRAADSMKFKINGALIDGTGAGQPEGILNGPATKICPIVDGQENDIKHANIRRMWALLNPASRSRAVWLCHPDMEERLETISFMDETSSRFPVYMPPGGLSGSGYGTLRGRPVIPSQHCHSLGEYGDLILVDWSQYITLRKQGEGIKRATSIHVRFLYDEQVFKFSTRIDGQSGWRFPIEDKHGGTTRGHVVVLGPRQASGETSSGL